MKHTIFAHTMPTEVHNWVLQQLSAMPTLEFGIHTITKYGDWVACWSFGHCYSQLYGKLSAAEVLKQTVHTSCIKQLVCTVCFRTSAADSLP